jgi:thiamine kinase-like enzyme
MIRRSLAPAGEILARITGRQIAKAHALTKINQLPARHDFRAIMPWLLTKQNREFDKIAMSDDVRMAKLGQFLQKNSGILDQMAQKWQVTHVIHGDLNWSNLLVINPSFEEPAILLIDWEYASLGDPLWDLAVLFSDFIIQSFTTSGQILPERLLVLIRAILTEYSSSTTDWKRIIQLAGLATLQRYYTWLLTQKIPPLVKIEQLFSTAAVWLVKPTLVLENQ